jgi:hypothetical protein
MLPMDSTVLSRSTPRRSFPLAVRGNGSPLIRTSRGTLYAASEARQ